jgi:hypothetical protein
VVAAAVVAGKSPLRIAQAMREKKARPSPGFFLPRDGRDLRSLYIRVAIGLACHSGWPHDLPMDFSGNDDAHQERHERLAAFKLTAAR